MSRDTEAVNEGFHSVFRRRPPNGNAAPLFPLSDILRRMLRPHPMGAEVDLPIRTNSYSPRCRFLLARTFP